MTSRVAVVTGSTSGIGAAIARRLHRDGFNVVVTGRNTERGNKVAEELGPGASFVSVDLAEPGGPEHLAGYAVEAYGRLDVVVNNAGIDHTGEFGGIPTSEIQRVFEVNAVAAIAVMQACANRMVEGGSIINVTSRLATIGVPTTGIYSAAKGALQAVTTAAAVELAGRNIRVNAIAPGMTKTPLYDAWLATQSDPASVERDVVGDIPMGRLASPDDIAAVASFLASEEASYLTGVSIAVDGGYTAR